MIEILLALIRRFEGKRLRAYLCPAGVWTIGYGATGPRIKEGLEWTDAQVEARLRYDADLYAGAAKRLSPALEGQMWAAIGDFCFNLGATRYAGSTLRRRINAKDYVAARHELLRWVRGGGRILPGLVIRRKAEAELLP